MSAVRQCTIETEPQRCTACRRCQLICSFLHVGAFTLDQERIVIAEDDHGVNMISFTRNCDKCGACVQYCVYGALKFGRG